MCRYALLVVALLTIIACVRASAESSESRQRWVNEINLYRCIHGLPPLLWDTGLADTASQFAEKLATTGRPFSAEPSRTTVAFGFGKFHCGDRYREFDQTCAVWFWYLQYLDTFGQEGCGSVTLAERTWSPRDIEDVKIMLSDRVEYVGCASRGHFYACKFDGNCGGLGQPCGKNTTELQHCVDEACFWCRDNTRVSSCWKWNPYVDLGTTTTTTTTTRPLVDGSKMYATTTSE
ncbi:hypothetical protein FOZ63_027755 [Perkinsus olseni]|uniref:SCP domain-containing protein n=1 Tax=Perkinsus olseni TaxID=32597 RepID=A0A7J6Q8I2_PEROL|nr:hypothetical protein FOZ62_028394 [Perkinsus olseni]KAF4738714.1 hypothetical protein FOZ63_027755 [Perkinsus olseni]